MQPKETMDMKGRIFIELHDREGRLVQHLEADNMIVLEGRKLVANRFLGNQTAVISHLAVGTGSTPVSDRDTALNSEIFRKALKPFDPQKDAAEVDGGKKYKVLLSTELDFVEGNGTLTEAGLFNKDKPGGIMYNRVVFPVVTKTQDFKFTLVWEIIF